MPAEVTARYNRPVKSHLPRLVLAAFLMGAAVPACEPLSLSKVAQGQLYQPGDSRFDGFFESVHKEQVDAASWGDDRKAARKPLVSVVAVTPNASDAAMVEALEARTKKGSSDLTAVTPAVDETSRAELERAKKLEVAGERLEQLAVQGRELADQQRRDYVNRGADKADEKKSAEMREVKSELYSAVDVISSLASDAKRGARSAKAFVADIQRLVGGDMRKFDDVKRPDDANRPEDGKKGDEKKGDPRKPDAKKPEGPKKADVKKPADAPRPAQKPSDEVFNP